MEARAFVRLLERLESEAVPLWLDQGVPPSLLEARAGHILAEAVIAAKLAAASKLDPGRAVLTALGGELGDDVEELRAFAEEYRSAASGEAALARVAHELAIVLQAKRYAKMGFSVENVLKARVAKALDEASRVESAEALQIVHELLSA